MYRKHVDQRPAVCEVLRQLATSEHPLWVTWQDRRLLLARVSDAEPLKSGMAVLVSTRRGYRRTELFGYWADRINASEQWREALTGILRRDRIRAVILEDHPRSRTLRAVEVFAEPQAPVTCERATRREAPRRTPGSPPAKARTAAEVGLSSIPSPTARSPACAPVRSPPRRARHPR